MKKQSVKKLVAILISVFMLVSFTAIGSYAKSKSKALEPITIKFLIPQPGSAEANKYSNDPIAQEIKKKLGITIEIQECDDSKFNVLLASGDLPDIITAKPELAPQLIGGGSVIPLDNLLTTNGKDILKNVPKTIALVRKYWSEGTNKVYYIPPHVGIDGMGIEDSIGPVIRWDLYKELGYPRVNNEDQLLSVLAQMQKKHPKTADGKKVYAVSSWSDWGDWTLGIPTMGIYGFNGSLLAPIVNSTNVMKNGLDANSPLMKALSFFYKAKKLGILDPDAFVQKWGDFAAKITAGQIYYTPATWATGDFNKLNSDAGKGFMALPFESGSCWAGSYSSFGWTDKSMLITKNAKYPERCMDLINYLFSYDGARTMYSGVKGQSWNTVKGKTQLTDKVIKDTANGTPPPSWMTNYVGMSPFTINPADKMPLSLYETSAVYSTTLSKVKLDYDAHYKISYPGEIFQKYIKAGNLKDQSGFDTAAYAMMTPQTDDMKRIYAKVDDLAVKLGVKAIMSKSDGEYQSNINALKSQFKAAGYDQFINWSMNAWKEARAKSAAAK